MSRFLIVDDHPLFREALMSALRLVSAEADIYEATSIEGALDMLDAHDDFELALLRKAILQRHALGLPLYGNAVLRDDRSLFCAGRTWFKSWSKALAYAGFDLVQVHGNPY